MKIREMSMGQFLELCAPILKRWKTPFTAGAGQNAMLKKFRHSMEQTKRNKKLPKKKEGWKQRK